MKTLLIAPELFRAEGGIARILRAYLYALSLDPATGPDVGVVVLNDPASAVARIPAYLRQARHTPLVLANRSKLRFIAACLRHGMRADHIVCGHIHLATVARIAQRLNPRLSYSIIAHGIDVWRPYTLREKANFARASRVLCVSEYTRRQILRFMPQLDPSRLVFIPNTLDPDFVAPEVPAPEKGPGPRILTVARLTTNDTYKGVDTLIEAMPAVRERLPGAHLVVVGGGNDQGRLAALAASHGGAEAIEMLGIVDDARLKAEYARCDLFALPSRKEGFGLVFLEAMSFGKPCLGARAGGVPEVVTEEVGELVEYGHIDHITDACVRLAHRRFDKETFRDHLQRYSFDVFRKRLSLALSHPDAPRD